MNETLDADFLESYGVEDFNYQLLQAPAEIPFNAYLKQMELEDLALPMLCPLARALYYIGRTEFSKYIDEALLSVVVLDPDWSERPSHELVHHTILKELDGNKYLLGFDSCAKFLWAGDDGDLIDYGERIGTLRDCTFFEPLTHCHLAEGLFALKSSELDTPMGEPVDDGEFVCYLEYTLSSVNGIDLHKKPKVIYGKHDLDWDELPMMHSASLPENAPELFPWTNLLSEEDRKRTGIDIGGTMSGDYEGHSERHGWRHISVDEIHQSYRSGIVVRSGLNRVEVLMGCGSEWTPVEDNDAHDQDDAAFDSRQPPLFPFILTDGNGSRQSGINHHSMALGYEEEFLILKLLVDSLVSVAH